MANTFLTNGTSSFRIRRPLATSGGFIAALDDTVKAHLTELDALLGVRAFSVKDRSEEGSETGIKKVEKAATSNGAGLPITVTLHKPLLPKKTTPDHWDNAGILNDLKKFDNNANPNLLSIADWIDKTNDLAALKYDFDDHLKNNWNSIDFNLKSVSGFKNVVNYLVAYAWFVKGIEEINALYGFVNTNTAGLKAVVKYAVVSSARSVIQKESLHIAEVNGLTYNDDSHPLMLKIAAANLSLSSLSFSKQLDGYIDDFIENRDVLEMIDKSGIDGIPDDIKPLLVKYIKSYPVKITPANIKFFLPIFINQAEGIGGVLEEPSPPSAEEADKDFDVQFLEDDQALAQVSTSNIKCAAQLFYSMTLGEELDVFNVANYFTHKYLIRNGIEIQDQRLREDLQMYVFSNKFTDPRTGRILDRTRAGERQMFYRQVFNYGNGPVTGDVIVNRDFPRLWKVLMLESAKYLERAQNSPNPDSYVSRQNVMQSVEDLQYNLSTHCAGMANVITPIIYAELNFVIRRILMHPEILRQVVPVGGTWWRVVESLYANMKQSHPKATVINNKAKLGQLIIRSIAEYNPAAFEQDKAFGDFISNVDAFITTQSILQENLADEIKDDENMLKRTNGMDGKEKRESAAKPSTAPDGKPATDEWDF